MSGGLRVSSEGHAYSQQVPWGILAGEPQKQGYTCKQCTSKTEMYMYVVNLKKQRYIFKS